MKDILTVFKEASYAAKQNVNTINGTVGVFMDENHSLNNPYVDHVLATIKSQDIAPYLSADGGSLFKKTLMKWAFKENETSFKETYYVSSWATLGGSGALAMALSLYGNDTDGVLLPNITWEYGPFLKQARKSPYYYDLFLEDQFNIEGFKKGLDDLTNKQQTVIVILNDPCHNPTGYTLKEKERIQIFKAIQAYPKHHIVLLYDLAYIDYSKIYESREVLKPLLDFNENVTTVLAMSGSKTFGLYGTRIGGLIHLTKQEQRHEIFEKGAYQHVVGIYSSPVSLGVLLIQRLYGDQYIPYLRKQATILGKRRNLFIKEAEAVGLRLYPTEEGFYIMIVTNDVMKSYERLKEQGIFLAPMSNGLRLSISSLCEDKISGLAKKIKDCLKDTL